MIVGIIGDLLRTNRALIEDTLEHTKKLRFGQLDPTDTGPVDVAERAVPVGRRRAPARRLGVYRDHRDAFRGQRRAQETYAARLLRRGSCSPGSAAAVDLGRLPDGARRRRADHVRDGGALRIGLGPFGLSSKHDVSVCACGPAPELDCDGVVTLQRGVRVVVDGGRLTLGHGTNVNGIGTQLLCAREVTIGTHCTFSWDVQVLDNDFHAITIVGVERQSAAPVRIGDRVWSARGRSCSRG